MAETLQRRPTDGLPLPSVVYNNTNLASRDERSLSHIIGMSEGSE